MRTVVGVDMQPIDEVALAIETFGTRYMQRLYTDHEIESCAGSSSNAPRQFAARFAAKEAVLKILDLSTTIPAWKSIEVRCIDKNRSEIVLHGEAEELAHQQGISAMSLSLSHDGKVAVAAVIGQLDEADREGMS